MGRIARHLSYANVTASLALFVALGGVSWAAVTLPRNSVGSKQIKKNAVTSSKVKDGTLKRRDFKSGTLLQGPQGPKGDPGQNGAPGQPGEPGTARAFAFVNPFSCAGATGPCDVSLAKNVVGARRIALGEYCVQVAPGIDPATSGSAAGVDEFHSDFPEGNGVAESTSNNSPSTCLASEFFVDTFRLPTSAPVTAGESNTVGFWLLVP